jgi:hypothetical protein
MSNDVNPFAVGLVDRRRAEIKSYHDQANHYYKREELSLGARFAAEREQYKAGATRDLTHLKHGHSLEIEDRRANLTRETEEKRGILARWVEEFRGRSAKEVEDIRQTGKTSLQDREHVHSRLLFELDQSEQRFLADDAHAKQLALVKKTDELAVFQAQRQAVYALENARFDTILAERKTTHATMLQEYGVRGGMGKDVITSLAGMLAGNLQAHSEMDKQILGAVISKYTRQDEHRNKMDEISARAEAGLSDDIGQYLRDTKS